VADSARLPGAPSEQAVDAADDRYEALRLGMSDYETMEAALAAAHDPKLGDARSVNERWCREDQTRRIVERLRQNAEMAITREAEHFNRALANLLAREFGVSAREDTER
jgi:hypothetical protein